LAAIGTLCGTGTPPNADRKQCGQEKVHGNKPAGSVNPADIRWDGPRLLRQQSPGLPRTTE
jgi:hypothetical protein